MYFLRDHSRGYLNNLGTLSCSSMLSFSNVERGLKNMFYCNSLQHGGVINVPWRVVKTE